MKCVTCHGSGVYHSNFRPPEPCPICFGKGETFLNPEYQPLNNRQESLKLAAELIAGRLEVMVRPDKRLPGITIGVPPRLFSNWGLSEADPGKVKDRSLCVLLSAVVAHCESDQGYSVAHSALIDLIQDDYLDPTRNDPLDAAFAQSVGFRPLPDLESVLFLQTKDQTRVFISENHPTGPNPNYRGDGIHAHQEEPEPPPFAWGRVLFRRVDRPRNIGIFDREGWLHTKTDLLRLLTCYGISPGSTELEPRPIPSPETTLTPSPR